MVIVVLHLKAGTGEMRVGKYCLEGWSVYQILVLVGMTKMKNLFAINVSLFKTIRVK